MTIAKSVVRPLLATLLCTMALPTNGFAQSPGPNLSQLSIEDLLNIEITSASRKEQRASDVAAAVFVITHDDIHRSGMTTIPDLLRQVPGVQVAQINSNKWAVSVRGFNGLYANKLLVLIDGRSVYNRIFSGVFWDAEDLMLDDVERIEVIRGPSAALWGANAVNGVINIITKTTADTLGGLVRVDGGRAGEQGAARYGGTLGAARYRLYAQWTGRNESLMAPGTRADDASHRVTTGFRADWATQPGAFTLEGTFTTGQARALWPNLDPQTAAREPIANDPSDSQGGHLLGRWTHTRASGASLFGSGVQPTARVMWKALPHQRLWAAVSRALRTPSLYERGVRVDFPPAPNASGLPLVITVLGNPAAETEKLVDVETGYRLEIGRTGRLT